MDRGWIKLHRELVKKAIWLTSTPEQKTILITLLMMANHDENEWEWMGKKYRCKPGEFITSVKSIMAESGKGISRQNVRSALDRFKKYGFLTIETTKTNTKISIVNWGKYQAGEQPTNHESNQEVTNDQPSGNHQVTTNKNDKNDKNDKKEDIYVQFVDGYHAICPSLARVIKITDSRKRAINARIKEDGLDVIKAVFEKVEASDFLTGRIGDFKATFDWILKPANFVKILEGNYDNRTDKPKRQSKQSDLEATFAAIDRLEQISGR